MLVQLLHVYTLVISTKKKPYFIAKGVDMAKLQDLRKKDKV
jgi:hypothetical protein